ncbi:hypothetical protein PHLCEN_2v2279 [Hermanssonia centrifuga]|uniref:F-box domain-containing protein n=1 Tax=Hermanssonia centrifuga TaxID=98765 RepID=A0A2R6RPJ9_9APHY|nr:hypothetical protein PHLCEN_2v2279 [Hermanssonia centrifuga]
MDTPTHTPVWTLPNEVLLQIASYIGFATLIRLRNVCKKWRAVVGAVQLSPAHRDLMDVYTLACAQPGLHKSTHTSMLPKLKHEDRLAYIFSVAQYSSQYQRFTQETKTGADDFLTWLFEWPCFATISGFSPAAAVFSLSNSSSYSSIGSVKAYYQERLLFLIAAQEHEIVLPRIKLLRDDDGQITCRIPNVSRDGFEGDWARFLPISGSDPFPQFDPNQGEPSLPLYVLSGLGLGERMIGKVYKLGTNATLQEEGASWADYLRGLLLSGTLQKEVLDVASPGSLPQDITESSAIHGISGNGEQDQWYDVSDTEDFATQWWHEKSDISETSFGQVSLPVASLMEQKPPSSFKPNIAERNNLSRGKISINTFPPPMATILTISAFYTFAILLFAYIYALS